MISAHALGRARFAAGLLVLCALVLPATSAGSQQSPTLSVSNVKLSGGWKEGWLTATLHFTITVGDAANVTAFIRPAAGGPVGATKDYAITQAGTITETLAMPKRPLPKAYVLRVFGRSGAGALPKVDTQFTVPSPPEGISDGAAISESQGGKELHAVKGPVMELWARFHFFAPPDAKTVVIVWRTPSYKFIGAATKPYKTTIDSFLRSTSPIPTGIWYAVMKVNGKIAKRIDIRIT